MFNVGNCMTYIFYVKTYLKKDDSLFKKKKFTSSRGAPQGNSSTRNPAIPGQLQNNKVPDCCHIGTSLARTYYWSPIIVTTSLRPYVPTSLRPYVPTSLRPY